MQATPAVDLSVIPAAQRAAVQALMDTVAALTEIARRQEHLIAELNNALHGKRSEKLAEDERQLAFEDLSIALAEVEAEKATRAATAGDDGAGKPAPKRTIGNLPATLPRIRDLEREVRELRQTNEILKKARTKNPVAGQVWRNALKASIR